MLRQPYKEINRSNVIGKATPRGCLGLRSANLLNLWPDILPTHCTRTQLYLINQ